MNKRFIIILFLISIALMLSSASPQEQGKLLSRVKYYFKHTRAGEVIEIKRVLRPDGTVQFISTPEGYSLDYIYQFKNGEDAAIRGIYGKIFGSLQKKYDGMTGNERVEIKASLSTPITQAILQRFGINPDSIQIETETVFTCKVNKQNLDNMKSDNDVVYIIEYYYELLSGGDEDWDNCPDVQNNNDTNIYLQRDFTVAAYNFPEGVSSIDANGDGIIDTLEGIGATGEGIKVGTLEPNIVPYYFDSLYYKYPFADISRNNIGVADSGDTAGHPEMTLRCAIDAAPKAILFHKCGPFDSLVNVNSLVHSISFSWTGNGGLDEFTYKFVNNNYKPFISMPSNNDGVGFLPDWRDYNVLNTGGANVTWKLDNYSRYYEVVEQPYWIYRNTDWTEVSKPSHTATHNPYLDDFGGFLSDRELPHVVTNTRFSCLVGAARDELNKHTTADPSVYRNTVCTSAGAPCVNGIGAIVMSARPDLMLNQPENVKVALMVTAENIDGGYWNPLEDGRDGCGMVSGYNAALYAKNVKRVYHNSSDTATNGIGYGTIASGQTNDLVFIIKTPASFPAVKHLRAVLTWTSSVNDSNPMKVALSDLNLELRHKNTSQWIGGCYSFEDNVEVIDIPNNKLNANDLYNLIVKVAHLEIPASSMKNYIFYSVGWTWVEDFAGKTVKNVTVTDTTSKFALLNRNMVVGPAVNIDLDAEGENFSFIAGNKIEIKPNAVGNNITLDPYIRKSKITVEVCKLIHSYYFSDHILTDLSGTMDGISFGEIQAASNHIDLLFADCRARSMFLEGKGYYELNVKEIDNNTYEKIIPELPCYPGLSLSTWVRFPEDMSQIQDGYIFSATDATGEKGFYLKVEGGALKFYIGEDALNNNVITHTIISDDLDNGQAANKGWLHVAAVWSPREYLMFYINGEEAEEITSNVISRYYSAADIQYFIGRGAYENIDYFHGAIENINLYAGVLKQKFIQSQYHVNQYPSWPRPTDCKIVLIECGSNGGCKYSSSGFMEIIHGGNSKNVRVARSGALELKYFIPEPGYIFDTAIAIGPQSSNNYWGYDSLPSRITISFRTLKEYSPDSIYIRGDRVKWDNRYYECLAGHKTLHPPQNPTTSLSDFWIELWKEGVSYQGEEPKVTVNRHVVKYPYYSAADDYGYHICINNHTSSSSNNPLNNTGHWKPTAYNTNTHYYREDIAVTQEYPYIFRCMKDNGPGNIQQPKQKFTADWVELINEYWQDVWSPIGEYWGKLGIAEYNMSFYVHLKEISPGEGDSINPSMRNYWLPISYWDAGKYFQRGDVVESDSVKFICYFSNTGESLQDTAYWRRFYLWPNTSSAIDNKYYKGEIVVTSEQTKTQLYRCILEHNPDSDSRPGVGVNWQLYWEEWNP